MVSTPEEPTSLESTPAETGDAAARLARSRAATTRSRTTTTRKKAAAVAATAEPLPDTPAGAEVTADTIAETDTTAKPVKPAKTATSTRKKTAKKTTRKNTPAESSTEPQDDGPTGALSQSAEDAAITADELGTQVADDAAADSEDSEDREEEPLAVPLASPFGLLFQAPDPTMATPVRRRAARPVSQPAVADEAPVESADPEAGARDGELEVPSDTAGESSSRRRRGTRGRRGRSAAEADQTATEDGASEGTPASVEPAPTASEESESASARRRRRRRRGSSAVEGEDPPGTVTKVREARTKRDEPTAVKGSTRLEAKKQRRREGREAGRRRTIITEAEFLARRESVDRVMVVRGRGDKTQIGVLEDGVLVEHYVSRETTTSMAGNVYLGRVQNVLPSMEAAFVDIGKGRNAVLYAGEVNWDAAGLEVNQAKRIENALSPGDTVMVQVTKDPIGHKGARLTSQISLPGRYLVYVPEGSMTGISRKLPDTERARLKAILKEVIPDTAGVIVRTAAEGASEEELRADVARLTKAWEKIQAKAGSASSRKSGSGGAPLLLHGEPDLTVRVIRDVFTEDYSALVVSGDKAWSEVSDYVEGVAPDLAPRVSKWTGTGDIFSHYRIDEQIAKAMDRKVWLPSGGSLVIDRTEAMTVVDVNTGRFVGAGGNLEETVTKNNIEAAEEIVRQLRLRDIGGIIVIDFIDMVLESNRDLVVRRLLECLGRDRTKHQVAEVTSLGLVQMTRKRVGSGLIEVFSEPCEHCHGRGITIHSEPVERSSSPEQPTASGRSRGRRGTPAPSPEPAASPTPSGPTAAQIAAAAHAAALRKADGPTPDEDAGQEVVPGDEAVGAEDTGAAATVTDAAAQAADAALQAIDRDGDLALSQADGPGETGGAAGTTPEAAAPASDDEGVAAPASRGRRRRGRVVAPAGPPRVAES